MTHPTRDDALKALETLSVIAHFNLHGDVAHSQNKCTEIIRSFIEGKGDTITIARKDVPEGLVEANRWYTSALLHKISADLTCPSPKENLEILLKTSALVAKEARK